MLWSGALKVRVTCHPLPAFPLSHKLPHLGSGSQSQVHTHVWYHSLLVIQPHVSLPKRQGNQGMARQLCPALPYALLVCMQTMCWMQGLDGRGLGEALVALQIREVPETSEEFRVEEDDSVARCVRREKESGVWQWGTEACAELV